MGKYIRKARGGSRAVEVTTQGPLGVRTRARAQALQKELTGNTNWLGKSSTSISLPNFAPGQIPYLELRSRRLEKVLICSSNKLPTTRKSSSAGECRRLSDLNSEIFVENSSSRPVLSVDEAQHARRQTRSQRFDEIQGFIFHCHGENDVEGESTLQGFVQRSLQQLTSRGRALPGVAHSRSNSRSNSVTREVPPPPRQLPPQGILTRNQRKLEKRGSDANGCSNKVYDMALELNASTSPKACGVDKSFNVEVSFGENPMDEYLPGASRLAQEGTPSSSNKEGNASSFTATAKFSSQLKCTTQHPSLDIEIEDFFLQAEQQLERRFIERYNFDPKNDTPLRGRYDWVNL